MNPNYEDMTCITRQKFDMAKGLPTLDVACRELKENAHLRTIREILAKAVGLNKNDVETLSKRLRSALEEVLPDTSSDTIRKNVSNWLKEDSVSIKKESAIQLAFALCMEYAAADNLIMSLCGERIHWREPKDIAYGFALNTGHSYKEAQIIYENLKQKGVFDFLDSDNKAFTESLEFDLLHITSTEALEQYLKEHKSQLGSLHNTALDIMDELLEVLKKDAATEKKVTVQEIMVQNLYGDLIPRTKRAAEKKKESKIIFDALQKSVRAGWPEETTLSKMGTHSTDATRKGLILLFLATDGGNSVYADWSEKDISREDVFEDRLERLSAMLVDCGYAPLDPRAPFDWMVLYCLCDEESFIDNDKMREFLATIFEGEAE